MPSNAQATRTDSILQDDCSSLPPIAHGGEPTDIYARLGLPSDEAMEEYDLLRTSTAPSEAFPSTNPTAEMRGFLFTDVESFHAAEVDDEVSSSPPNIMETFPELYTEQGQSPRRLSSAPGQFLDDMLPSSMGLEQDDESDSQKTRLVRNSSREVGEIPIALQARTKEEDMGIPESADGENQSPKDTLKIKDADNSTKNCTVFPDTQYPDSPELLSTKLKHQTTPMSDKTERPKYGTRNRARERQRPVTNSASHENDIEPKMTKKRPDPKEPRNNKRARKQNPERQIPPLPEFNGNDTGVDSEEGREKQDNFAKDTLLKPSIDRRDHRRRSSFKVAENGSPMVEYMTDPSSPQPEGRQERRNLVQAPPILNSEKSCSGFTPTGGTCDKDLTFQNHQQKAIHTTSRKVNKTVAPSVSRIRGMTCYEAMTGTKFQYQIQPPKATLERKDAPFHLMTTHIPARNQLVYDDSEGMLINPPVTCSRPEMLGNFTNNDDSSALRRKIAYQISQREARRRLESHPDQILTEKKSSGATTEHMATQKSPMTEAVQQTTSSMIAFVDKQKTIITSVIEEYKTRTHELVRQTKELHLREAAEIRTRLENKHKNFLTMCDEALARIEEAKRKVIQKPTSQTIQINTQMKNLEKVLQVALQGIGKLQDSAHSKQNHLSQNELAAEIKMIIDAPQSGKAGDGKSSKKKL